MKKNSQKSPLLILLALLMFSGIAKPQAAQAQTTKLLVSAAASLKDVLTEIGGDYTKTHPDTSVAFNFGSSGALQTQIVQGAPVDVFISAADKNMDDLAKANLIDSSTRVSVANNTLVLIVPLRGTLALHSFKDVEESDVKNVAIGGPEVPAGMRAQEVFTKLGIWPQVQAKAVQGKDVREVLTQVELGNVDAGVVYSTDAATSSNVIVVATAPESMHKPIRYPAAVIAGSKNAAAARDFVTFLTSEDAKTVLRKYKFIVK